MISFISASFRHFHFDHNGDGIDGPNGVQNTSTQCAWMGHIHIMHLGPLADLYGTPGAPKRARFSPERAFWGPGGQDLVPTAPDWIVYVELMVTTHFDLVSGSFWAHRGPIRARFGPKCSFWGPRRAPGDQIWSHLLPIGPPGLVSWSPHTLT